MTYKYRRSGLDLQFFVAQPSFPAWTTWSCRQNHFLCLSVLDAMTNRFDAKKMRAHT